MASNSFGRLLQLTTFGESHSEAVGGVLDGFPPNIPVDFELIKNEVARRKTGKTSFESQRKENDEIKFLSGIFEGKTIGTPIAFVVYNNDAQSKNYENIKDIFRPSHADFTYQKKYGIRDFRGGGRASARETLSWVIAGAFAKMLLKNQNITIIAYVSQIGNITVNKHYTTFNLSKDLIPPLFCPDNKIAKKMLDYLKEIEKEGDTIGGKITCIIKNCPVGLGEPVFDKLHAQLAKAMMSINAVKGFEYGSGFSAAEMKGSEHNDIFENNEGTIKTKTNNSGGIQGGISNGNDIYFSVAFKPVASIKLPQNSVDIEGNKTTIIVEGCHDVCPIPRAVPIVEAMAALVIADNLMMNAISKHNAPII